MPYLYLLTASLTCGSSSVLGGAFNRRHATQKNTAILYDLFMIASACALWWCVYLADFSFEVRVLGYSALFAIGFSLGAFCLIQALKYGPTPLTALFNSLSLIVTTVWGFGFWGETPDALVIIGLALVVISIYFCLCAGKKTDKPFSWKWLALALLSMLGNAACAIVQRTQQQHFSGAHGSMLMAFSMAFSLAVFALAYPFLDKPDHKIVSKQSFYFPALAGACNMLLNFCVVKLATSALAPSFIYPVISVGGLTMVTLVTLLVFKEKLSWQRWAGVAIGAVAIVLLSI